MIHRVVLHNGAMLPVEQVRLSPGQAGLMSGWGIFTTMRIIEGIPFAFERHWKRLTRDAQKTHCPFPFLEETVHSQLHEVLRANRVREGCARIYAIYNQVGFWRSDEELPATDLLICSADLPPHKEPVRLALREHGRYAASPLAGVKVTSWLNNVWSLYEAQQGGFDEVVLLNERGEVAECTAANIFCVRDGRVLTPPLSSGCLEGVTRGVVLEIGAGAGVPVEARTLRPEDLYSADGVFISSTNRNIIAAGEINGRKIATAALPVMEKLEKAFSTYVREYVESRTAAAGKR
ncbi:MAG TPA: aminotransferase class IV [Candidatus Acidoferrales bacterium]|jgi:branched-chain amino acid aminotransferase|nr:aminotransferase class IV [Candidatus Acidoferrales bacterium]